MCVFVYNGVFLLWGDLDLPGCFGFSSLICGLNCPQQPSQSPLLEDIHWVQNISLGIFLSILSKIEPKVAHPGSFYFS